MANRTVFITGGTTFTVPSDFSSLVSVECIGGGAGAGYTANGNIVPGGGGGAWAKITSLTGLTAGGSANVSVGAGGLGKSSGAPNEGGDGGDTYFSIRAAGGSPTSTSEGVLAKGGLHGAIVIGGAATGGAGGALATSIGTSKFAGGAGGNTVNSDCGIGGGGAGGPNGTGGKGGYDSGIGTGGTGGGGADGGGAGADSSGAPGRNGGASGTDATAGGIGGTSADGNPGSHGSGGGGGAGGTFTGGVGGQGVGWVQTSDSAVVGPGGGAGGGGGSGTNGGPGANGGLYGGGGSGGGRNRAGGSGAQGIIIFTYTPIATRDWYSAEGLTEQTTTATAWTTQCTLTFTPKPNIAYVIFWSAAYGLGSITVSGLADLYDVTNATQLVSAIIQEGTLATDYPSVGGQYILASTSSPVSRSFAIRFSSETAGTTTKMKNARLVALELTANDIYAEDVTETSTTVPESRPYSGWPTKLTANMTVPTGGGTYLIIFSAQFRTSDATLHTIATVGFLLDDTAIYTNSAAPTRYLSDFPATHDELTDVAPVTTLVKETLTAGAHTAKIRWATIAGTAYITQARIVAIRLDDGVLGDSSLYAELTTSSEAVSRSTTYGDVATVTSTVPVGNYLVLGAGSYMVNSTTVLGYQQVLLDGTTTVMESARCQATGLNGTNKCWTAGVIPLSAASHTLALQEKTGSGTLNTFGLGAVIAIKLPQRPPREVQYVEGLAQQSTTSNSAWTTQATLTFTPATNKDYVIFWTGSMTTGSLTDDGQVDLYDATSGTELVLQNIEPLQVAAPADYGGVGGMYFHKAPMILLHMDGADEGTTFVDSSPYARKITAFGNAKTDNAQFKFGTTSAFFDGSGDYVTIPDSADLELGTSDFTIHLWARPASVAGAFTTIFGKRQSGGIGPVMFTMQTTTLSLIFWNSGSSNFINTNLSTTMAANTWYHLATTRSGNIFRGFLNGALIYTSGTFTDTLIDITENWAVGAQDGGSQPWNGWVDEVVVEIGVARWTAAFTPPTQPYGVEARSFATRFKSETNAITTKMQNTRMVALELTSDDSWGESLTRTTTTNAFASPATKVTDSITVPTGGGEYLAIGSWHLDTAGAYVEGGIVTDAGTPIFFDTSGTQWTLHYRHDDATTRLPCMQFAKKTFTAGSHSAGIVWDKLDAAATVGCEQARVLLLRLNDSRFLEYFYAESLSGTNVAGSATYFDVGSLNSGNPHVALNSQTLAGGAYFILGFVNNNARGVSAYTRLRLDNTTDMFENVFQAWTNESWVRSDAGVGVANFSAGSHTIALQQKNETGTGNCVSTGALAVINLAPSGVAAVEYGFYMGFGIV